MVAGLSIGAASDQATARPTIASAANAHRRSIDARLAAHPVLVLTFRRGRSYPAAQMRRRWIVLAELLLLSALVVWAAFSLVDPLDRPAGAIDLKVQLRGAADRVFLLRDQEGALRWQITSNSGEVSRLTPQDFSERLYRDQSSRGSLEVLLNVTSNAGLLWVGVGLLGQLLFTGRMVVQWIVSEKSRRSVVPPVFWWMSLIGATMLLVYFLWRKEPIGVLGQATGWFIYVRNLWLIHRPGRPSAAPPAPEEPVV
ncbi:MAG: hypothetical protein Fur0037_21880 [Planctomycetota bacterium]